MKISEASSTSDIRDSMRSPGGKREPPSSPVFFGLENGGIADHSLPRFLSVLIVVRDAVTASRSAPRRFGWYSRETRTRIVFRSGWCRYTAGIYLRCRFE